MESRDFSAHRLRVIGVGGIYGFDVITGSGGASEIFTFCSLIFIPLTLYQIWISEYQSLIKARSWLMIVSKIERATTYATAKITAFRLQEICQRLGLSSWKTVIKVINIAIRTVYFMKSLRIFNFLAFGMMDTSSWSCGQIVAITVWAGPIVEYIHLEMRNFAPLLKFSTIP